MPGQRRGAKDQEVELNDDFLNLTFATSTTLDKYNHLSFTSPSPRSNSGRAVAAEKEKKSGSRSSFPLSVVNRDADKKRRRIVRSCIHRCAYNCSIWPAS